MCRAFTRSNLRRQHSGLAPRTFNTADALLGGLRSVQLRGADIEIAHACWTMGCFAAFFGHYLKPNVYADPPRQMRSALVFAGAS